jgi:hypothetical protein
MCYKKFTKSEQVQRGKHLSCHLSCLSLFCLACCKDFGGAFETRLALFLWARTYTVDMPYMWSITYSKACREASPYSVPSFVSSSNRTDISSIPSSVYLSRTDISCIPSSICLKVEACQFLYSKGRREASPYSVSSSVPSSIHGWHHIIILYNVEAKKLL